MVSVTFTCIIGRVHAYRTGGESTLLHHMGQLMCQQPLPTNRLRRILSRSENNISSQCIRPGMNCLSCLCRLGISMDAHLTKIMAEAWFHEGTDRPREKLTSTSDRVNALL